MNNLRLGKSRWMMDLDNFNSPINSSSVEKFAIKIIENILPSPFKSHFCLAGGCFKSLIHNKEPNDIDLWPVSERDRLTLIDELVSNGGKIASEGEFNSVITLPNSNNENHDNQSNEGIDSRCLLSPEDSMTKNHESCDDLNFKNRVKAKRMLWKVEVTRKCPSSLEKCLAEFDLVLSCIGVEFWKGNLIQTSIHPEVKQDIINREVNIVKGLKLHKYNLLSLNRLHRYAAELDYSVPKRTIEFLWVSTYFNKSETEKRDMLQSASLCLEDVPMII